MQPKGIAIRKRTQITMANRVMFLWVAGVSALLGITIVVTIFLVQMLMFNERVLHEKGLTIATLNTNNENIEELKSKIRILDTNEALNSIKAKSDDKAIQVILDALPTDPNDLALGASIQNKILHDIDLLELDSMQIDKVLSSDTSSSTVVVDEIESSSITQGVITFRFTVFSKNSTEGSDVIKQVNIDAIKKALINFEKSIRIMDLTSIKIEQQRNTIQLSIKGRAFYEPTRVVQLIDKVVK